MSERYNQAAERLWEKIEAHREKFIFDYPTPLKFSPWDRFCERNPAARNLSDEVDKELNYQLSERQCSWAVVMAVTNYPMGEYNRENNLSLIPRV